MNGQLFTSNNNGLDAVTKKTPAPTMQFDTLYMRHISLMVSWKRSLLFMAHTADNGADKLFAKGECAVLTSNSGSFGQFRRPSRCPSASRRCRTTRPPAMAASPSSAARPCGRWKAIRRTRKRPRPSSGRLSKPVVAAEWHQRTGYLPLTEAAFRASDVSFYKSIPGAQAVIASMSARPSASSRGFRMANYAY